MEQGILTSTKKILGLGSDYTAFDQDILTHINSAFAVLYQLGVGPSTPFSIEDDSSVWSDFVVPTEQLSLIKSYFYLKVRTYFDPPTTSFHIEAMNNQIKELEWRLSTFREEAEWTAG